MKKETKEDKNGKENDRENNKRQAKYNFYNVLDNPLIGGLHLSLKTDLLIKINEIWTFHYVDAAQPVICNKDALIEINGEVNTTSSIQVLLEVYFICLKYPTETIPPENCTLSIVRWW